jgi:hypothetical protein
MLVRVRALSMPPASLHGGGNAMRELRTSLPFVALIAATRGLLGVGIGLLISERIGRRHRVEVGATLAAIGALSTVPLAIGMFRKLRARETPNIANVPQSGFDKTNEEILAH